MTTRAWWRRDIRWIQKIPDVAEPASGSMWGNADAHGKTHYNFGEFIASTFCGETRNSSSEEGPVLEGAHCEHGEIAGKGDAIPLRTGAEE